ncbi:hypothetical protein G7Y89_g13582 [Cudoniella acicularis]|uniref:Uncharacterized protein n=1 Tax=Cudoniella acicularis TaxID=354080 RepID=A0A8H4R759_9HELO|nr:hypothetical protein G7Y89_g13582 [Cudoniella acicularis]
MAQGHRTYGEMEMEMEMEMQTVSTNLGTTGPVGSREDAYNRTDRETNARSREHRSTPPCPHLAIPETPDRGLILLRIRPSRARHRIQIMTVFVFLFGMIGDSYFPIAQSSPMGFAGSGSFRVVMKTNMVYGIRLTTSSDFEIGPPGKQRPPPVSCEYYIFSTTSGFSTPLKLVSSENFKFGIALIYILRGDGLEISRNRVPPAVDDNCNGWLVAPIAGLAIAVCSAVSNIASETLAKSGTFWESQFWLYAWGALLSALSFPATLVISRWSTAQETEALESATATATDLDRPRPPPFGCLHHYDCLYWNYCWGYSEEKGQSHKSRWGHWRYSDFSNFVMLCLFYITSIEHDKFDDRWRTCGRGLSLAL